MDRVLIGIDLGTTGCKSVVFDERLNIIAGEAIACPLITISPDEIEQDPETWWEAVKYVVRESVRKAEVPAGIEKCLSVSAQGLSLVPVDKDLSPLRNAFCWLDKRATIQKDRIIKEIGEDRLFEITGIKANEKYMLSKVLWFKENELALYDRTFKLFTAHEFIVSRLCGNAKSAISDHTMAWGSMMYDIEKRDWSQYILRKLGLDPGKLPEIKQSGAFLGRMDKKVAAELGLNEGASVTIGGQDQKCAALGAGITDGIAAVSLGTATAITILCSGIVRDPFKRIPCSAFLLENKWVLEGVAGTSCASLKWLRDTLFPNETYAELDSIAEQCYGRENDLFFYPYLSGGGTPGRKRNLNGFFYGITLSTSRADIIKSVLEGVAYQIVAILSVMEEISGPVRELRVFGGGSGSRLWCQMISDITGKKVSTLYTAETACIGAAIMAGVGTGIFKDAYHAAGNIKIRDEFLPDSRISAMYRRKYEEYMEILSRME